MFSKLKEKLRGSREAAMSELDRENALEQLQHFDTQFLIDDSASMAGTRWTEAQDALTGLADKALRHDTDGIEIHFLNAVYSRRTVTNEEEVRQAFYAVKPAGYTPTGNRLEEILTQYITRLETAKATESSKSGDADPPKGAIKPLNLIVITDGEPTDDPESVIIAAARRLDTGHFSLNQVGIQFIQIGDDKKATKALHELDNHLSKVNGTRDMVDTRPYKGKTLTPELLIAMLLGGINRRVDNIKKPGQQSK